MSPRKQQILAFRRHLLALAFRRENRLCFYCDVPVSWNARRFLNTDAKKARALNAATLDHLIPKSSRIIDAHDNTVCACLGCNQDRGDKPAIDFLYERRRALARVAA